MSRRLDDDWPESPVDPEVAYLPSTPTGFDKELRKIIRIAIQTAKGDAVHRPDEALAEEAALEKSKQVVDKYVIGDWVQPHFGGREVKPGEMVEIDLEHNVRESLTFIEDNAQWRLQQEQRQSLWGTK